MSEIDQNKIASEVITNLIKEAVSVSYKAAFGSVTRKIKLIIEDFDDYVDRTLQKCSDLRVIIDKSKEHRIDDIYVKSFYSLGDEIFDDDAVMQDVRDGQPVVVMGFGGIGKTIFSKRLWKSIYSEPAGKIPIFFELRQLNSITDIDILTTVRHSLGTINSSVEDQLFKEMISAGRFVFIFDGFDELPEEKKKVVERQVLEISHACRSCGICVSGRIDDRFESWERFRVYRAMPFEKEQVKDLVGRVNYDKQVAKKFLSEIVEAKFEQYEEFLQTPLLALMMLMTYSQSGEVPDKRSIFYKYAFMTLYTWHDGSKEAFTRERKTGLDIEQFERIFSIFCLVSYLEYSFQMTEDVIRANIRKAKKYVDFDFEEENLILECVESVNLLYKEGESFNFVHRSFQEYFTAFAAVNYFQSQLPVLVNEISYRGGEAVLPLMVDINEDVVDERIIGAISDAKIAELIRLSKIRSTLELHKQFEIGLITRISRRKSDSEELLVSLAGEMCFHEDYELWSNIIALKREKYNYEIGTINNIEYRYNISEEILNFINDKIEIDDKTMRFFAMLNYGRGNVTWMELEEKEVFGANFKEMLNLDGINFNSEKGDVWAENAAAKFKSHAVFALKRIQEAKKKMNNKEKSIDEILG